MRGRLSSGATRDNRKSKILQINGEKKKRLERREEKGLTWKDFFPFGFHLCSSRVRAIFRDSKEKETDRSLPFSVENSLFFVLIVDILFILKIHMGSGLWVLRIALKAVRSKSPYYGGVETWHLKHIFVPQNRH